MRIHVQICRVISYIIAYSVIIAAATNDGFSGFTLGIPFAIYLAIDSIILLSKKSPIALLHIPFLMLSIYITNSDKSTWKLIHPLIYENIIVKADINITHNQFFPYQLEFPMSKQSDYTLQKGESFTVTKQIVTGHPDFGTSYIFQLKSNTNPSVANRFIHNAEKLIIDFGALRNDVFLQLDKSKIYIDPHSLFRNNHFSYNESRLNRFNGFGTMLMYPTYIPLFIIFIIVSFIYLTNQRRPIKNPRADS